MTDLKVMKDQTTWVVRGGGSIIAETNAAKVLLEGQYDNVIYIPRDDIAMIYLDPSDTRSTCPKKGEATHFDLTTPEGKLVDVAWSYETPRAEVADLAGHLAFYANKVTVEAL